LNAEELVRQQDPACAKLPPLLDEESNLPIYPTTKCDPTNCVAPCSESFVDEIESRFSGNLAEKDDGQEPFCDEYLGSTDGDDEVRNNSLLILFFVVACTIRFKRPKTVGSTGHFKMCS
jgi:hypothetical protein